MKKTPFAFLAAAVGAAGLTTVDAAHARGDVVTMKEAVTPGTIIVRTQERRLPDSPSPHIHSQELP